MAGEFSVPEVRAAIKSQGARWTAARTTISALKKDDRRKWLGALPDEEVFASQDVEDEEFAAAGAAPSTWDWRDSKGGHDWTTPVKSQCGCGSCVAFAAVGALECQLKILRNNHADDPNFSEAHLFFCNNRQCNSGDANYGWNSSSALNYLRDTGVPDEACFPYTCPANNQACNTCTDWQDRATRITKWKSIGSKSGMKQWLSEKGPLVACYTVYDDFFSYSSGVYEHVTGDAAGGHCIAVVGYDDSAQCWICKNSWGAGWGESGYFRIKYGQCGIDSSMKAIEGVKRYGWQNAKKINGLWAIDENRNAWVHVQGLGWRKLSDETDSIAIDLMIQAAHAKEENRNVNFYEEGVEGGTIFIKQIYTW